MATPVNGPNKYFFPQFLIVYMHVYS